MPRRSPAARRAHIDSLEPRRLLSAATPSAAAFDWSTMRLEGDLRVVDAQLNGDTVTAVAGRFVAELDFSDARTANEQLRPSGVRVERALGDSGLFALTAPLGTNLGELAGMLGTSHVDPEFLFTVDALDDGTPNDPYFNNGSLWGLRNDGNFNGGSTPDADSDADDAWKTSTGEGAVVGVIDTGVDWDHPDLADNIWVNPGEIAGNGIDDDGNGYVDDTRGWDFFFDDNDARTDGNSHGTHVAGTIAAVGDDGRGVVGVAPGAKVIPIKVGDGGRSLSSSAILEGMYYLADLAESGVNIVATNNSYGGGGYWTAFRNAISLHNDLGILFVASSGNDGADNDTSAHYPDGYNEPNVISVAAMTDDDVLANFSNFGATSVDLAAPGRWIRSTVAGGGYSYYSGTSMAAPHVAGAVATVAAANTDASAADVKAALLDGVVPVAAYAGKTLTGGRLNVADAVDLIVDDEDPTLQAPQNVALAAASDTGISSNDNVTKDLTPTFTGSATPGVKVELLADGDVVATRTVGSAGTFSITSPSVVARYTTQTVRYEAVAVAADGTRSAPSAAVDVTLDTERPTITGGGVLVDAAPHAYQFTFSEQDIVFAPAAKASNFTVKGTGSRTPVQVSEMTADDGAVTVTFAGNTSAVSGASILRDGFYSIRAANTTVQDLAGNVASTTLTGKFRVLTGDIDANGTRNADDRSIILDNLNTEGGHSRGDVTYDGLVNQDDLDAFDALTKRRIFRPFGGGTGNLPGA